MWHVLFWFDWNLLPGGCWEELNIIIMSKEQDKKIYSITAKYLHCSFLFKMQMVKLRIEN